MISAKFSAYVEFSAYFYLYPEAIADCDSFKSLMTFAERKAMVLAYGYRSIWCRDFERINENAAII